MVIKSKVAVKQKIHEEGKLRGIKKCGNACSACPHINPGKYVKIDDKTQWKINKKVSCNTYNVIYLISCNKEYCKENRYIGETGHPLKYRLADHRGYVNNYRTDNLPGHSLDYLNITAIEKVKKCDPDYRKERKKYFINKFKTFHNGMNRQV